MYGGGKLTRRYVLEKRWKRRTAGNANSAYIVALSRGESAGSVGQSLFRLSTGDGTTLERIRLIHLQQIPWMLTHGGGWS